MSRWWPEGVKYADAYKIELPFYGDDEGAVEFANEIAEEFGQDVLVRKQEAGDWKIVARFENGRRARG